MRVQHLHALFATTATFLVTSVENSAFEVGNALADDSMLRSLVTDPPWVGNLSVFVTQVSVHTLMCALVTSVYVCALAAYWDVETRETVVVSSVYFAIGLAGLCVQGVIESFKSLLNLNRNVGTTQLGNRTDFSGGEAAQILSIGLATEFAVLLSLVFTLPLLHAYMHRAARARARSAPASDAANAARVPRGAAGGAPK